MKKLTTTALAITAITASFGMSQSANAEVSANIGATSNYIWRGVSQSSNSASVSGGIDYANDSGFYAGTWVGSLGDDGSGFNGAETDLYFGFGGESGSFGYDVGYIYYLYTELDDSNFGEIYFNGSINNFGFGIAYTVNSDLPDGAGFETGDIFLNVSYGGIDLGNDFELGFTLGSYMFDSDGGENDYDYSYVQADISKGDFTFSISKAQESGFADEDLKLVASCGTSF